MTFREDYVFRGKVTDARYERRAETILHEMAHMWFGDLVTMRWWDDLWLNESFATYASVLCQTTATRWTDSWTTFANAEKTWAYRQDQLPSTHPIATDAPDVQTAEVNFDGITYAKGASVLKQLGAYVGVEAFLAGLRDYFVEHAYGNTTLADLLPALEESSGRELGDWSKLWLETTGINTLRPEFTLDAAAPSRRSRSCRRHRPRSQRRTCCARTGSRSASTTSRRASWSAPGASNWTSPASAPTVPELVGVDAAGCAARQRRRPDLLQAAPGQRPLAYSADRRDREAGRLAAARAVLVGRVGHDPRRRAADPRLRGAGRSPARRPRPTSA